ncbi:hypothetical protein [Portibacter marinus]|uniref:hypothetical protein n=1 Tax=Portibacter marinus TaxID=2898660 RepID=UPI001F26291F|nr:hypothetical protein [Portibacter marinus]
MEQRVTIIKKDSDDPNIAYWASQTPQERLSFLETIRKEVIKSKYGIDPGFQRVVNIIKR